MLALEDCIALSNLTEEEVDAIALHDRLPQIIAAEFGNYLLRLPEGRCAIRAIIMDDIAHAQAQGDHVRSAQLKLVLKHFAEHMAEASI